MIINIISLNILWIFYLKCVLSVFVPNGVITNETEFNANVTLVSAELRRLDKELTSMFTKPVEDNGDAMLDNLEKYNRASIETIKLANLNVLKVVKELDDILDFGGPRFLTADFEEEKLKAAFKWEQETMDKVSMMRLKIGEHWFDLWSVRRKIPDYDMPKDQ